MSSGRLLSDEAKAGEIINAWGNLSAMTDTAAGDLMDRLTAEEEQQDTTRGEPCEGLAVRARDRLLTHPQLLMAERTG